MLQAALSWVASGDPTKGMEYITEAALAEDDPYENRYLAKALLQERANLLDFISQVCAWVACISLSCYLSVRFY